MIFSLLNVSSVLNSKTLVNNLKYHVYLKQTDDDDVRSLTLRVEGGNFLYGIVQNSDKSSGQQYDNGGGFVSTLMSVPDNVESMCV